MRWIYDSRPLEEQDLESYVGFVYMITNNLDGRRYIGKKLFKNKKIKVLKGKKKRFLVDSDWQDYWGSNKPLQEDVVRHGTENFTREVLMLCKSKGECNYFEAMYQFQHKVLESKGWYNDHIWTRVHRSHLQKAVNKPKKRDNVSMKGDTHAVAIQEPSEEGTSKSRIKQKKSKA